MLSTSTASVVGSRLDRLVGWLVGWLIDWLVGWLVGWLIGWLVGRRDVWMPGCLVA